MDDTVEVIRLLEELSNRLLLPPVCHDTKPTISSELLKALTEAKANSFVDETEYEFSVFRLDLDIPHDINDNIEKAIQRIINVYHQVVFKIAHELSTELRIRKTCIASDNNILPFMEPRFIYKLDQYFQYKLDQIVELIQSNIYEAITSLFSTKNNKPLAKESGDALLKSYYALNTVSLLRGRRYVSILNSDEIIIF